MRAKAETKKTTDALAILDQMAGESPELRRLTAEARVNAAVAQLIYAARNKAGLSQAELAERIGTKQSVISRLEDADYEGHSLSMLHRIAAALGQCVEIRFLPAAKVGRDRRPRPRLGVTDGEIRRFWSQSANIRRSIRPCQHLRRNFGSCMASGAMWWNTEAPLRNGRGGIAGSPFGENGLRV